MNEKPFKTIDEQINILKSRGLIFENEDAAKNSLKQYGYYEIINGYKTPFLKEGSSEQFNSTATFEHIFALYKLDKTIATHVLSSLEQFEQTFKQSIAYVIAENISVEYSSYVAKSHYNTGKTKFIKKGIATSEREFLLKKLNKTYNSKANPIKYYREKYGNVPPWIIVKGLTFGESIYWYKLSKPNIRVKIISRMFGLNPEIIDAADKDLKIKQLFGDLLSLYLTYRNQCAHGGQIYNHRSKKYGLRNWSPYLSSFDTVELTTQKFDAGKLRSSIGIVHQSLSIFDNKSPYVNMLAWILAHLENYLKLYPEDKEMLLKETELTTIFEELEKNIN